MTALAGVVPVGGGILLRLETHETDLSQDARLYC